MSDCKFETGQVVHLNSGGIKMTVEAVDGDDVHCVWTDRQQKLIRDTLPASCLSDGGDRIGKLLQEIHESEEDA